MGTSISPTDLLKHVDVVVTPESAIMEIFYTDPSPQQARDGAAAVADAYLAYKGRTAEASNREDQDAIGRSAADLNCAQFPKSSSARDGCDAYVLRAHGQCRAPSRAATPTPAR